LNLKGGVGKTTLVANLAAGYATGIGNTPLKVLVVDLDYQGTLSNMCVRQELLRDRRVNKNTSRVLLEDESLNTPCGQLLQRLMVPVGGTQDRAWAVVADETLDHIDFRQQARFAVENREVRFHHRKLFHDPFVFQQFDLVFFDCPPRLTTSSINALAASDYIVLPTSLHPNDVDAVRRTLQWWEKLHAIKAFQAKLAGVVLNRTFRRGTAEDLTKDEKISMEQLHRMIQPYEPTGGAVLRHVVPNTPAVARFAAGHTPLGANEQGYEVYGDTAKELLKRIRA
jgi:cellulose biosynthesis protein BcsQ